MASPPSEIRLTLPNALTLFRIAAAPLLTAAVFCEAEGLTKWGAVIVLAAAALTDLIDGPLARALNQVSTLGAILDPIADKILMTAALFLLAADGTLRGLALLPALLILWREFLISGLREYWRHEGIASVVSRFAKWKTALQFSCVVLLFASRAPSAASALFFQSGAFLLWAAALLTLYSGGEYLRQAWRMGKSR